MLCLCLVVSACGGSSSSEKEHFEEPIEERLEQQQESTSTTTLPAASTTTVAAPTATAVPSTTTAAFISKTAAPSTTAAPASSTTSPNVSEDSEPPTRPVDSYSCVINSAGYCVFTGQPHPNFLKPHSNIIVNLDGAELFSIDEAVATNSEGEILQARGTPAFDGDELFASPQTGMTNDQQAFHRVMAIMFGIRNQLMYDIEDLDKETWDSYLVSLAERGIKETTFTDGMTPKQNYYGRDGIFELAKKPDGRDIHHDVMKFLEESGLYLLCHVTSDEFAEMLEATHPEGHDPCEEAGVLNKVPFADTD